MDLLNHVSHRIAALDSGEQWIVSAQKLLISRTDFQSLSVFLSRESEKGLFSLSPQGFSATWHDEPVVTIIKH
ncbi:hypothetical protein ACNAUY_03070 [Acinetobacter tibetensis]|jgi:hypothetical protein|uniref:Uncharacterized protein n=1 Tax=Acinetobacter tibetensis TaxID=2943497 RepID=A0AAE9LQW0_9GAMM|nr:MULTISPECIES: hypothetical protein [Acinetobacter]PWB13719.1 hypothetical protein DCO44_12600 [Acinetobacter sp. AM]USE83084.1 hypothetical protein M5E07_15135 [Acinetobacter tibetensis]HEX5382016.1 hypothetical protein [Acinetobacter sp.]